MNESTSSHSEIKNMAMTSVQSARSEWFVNGQFLNHMAKFVDWSPEHGYQSN